jgi:hypothetical protein
MKVLKYDHFGPIDGLPSCPQGSHDDPQVLIDKPLDLIVALGAPAAGFIQRHRNELFPATPLILTAIERRRVQQDRLTENDTVIGIAFNFQAIFENILHVLPDTKLIAIVNGTSPNEIFWLGELRRELIPFANRVELKWLYQEPFPSILNDSARLPPHSAIFFAP